MRYFGNPLTDDADGQRLKVPHMGWNRGASRHRSPAVATTSRTARFYFVHSYYVHARQRDLLAGSVQYGVTADAALARDNLFAVQFHPEKSAGRGPATAEKLPQLDGGRRPAPRPMLIIPAIDLKDGQCVRLRQGLMDDSTVFSDDPVAMAARWVDAGCRRLHLVDLNGAFAGEPVNGEVVDGR